MWAAKGAMGFNDMSARIPGSRYVVLFDLRTSSWDLRCLALANALVELMELCASWGSHNCRILSMGFRFSPQKRVRGLLVFDDSVTEAFHHVRQNAEQGSQNFCLYQDLGDPILATHWMGDPYFEIDASAIEDTLRYARYARHTHCHT